MSKFGGCVLAVVALVSFSAHAQKDPPIPPVAEITKQVLEAATHYAVAVSCVNAAPHANDIAALVPWKVYDDRENAEYLVFWQGDVGCLGRTGTSGPQAALVKIGGGTTFYVDPTRSSPAVQLELPMVMERLVGNTKDSLVVDGIAYGDKDPQCCPSLRTRYTLRPDARGNWKVAEKKALPKK